MKKKMFATGLAALFAASATFAADFTFSNKVSSNLIDSWHWSSKNDAYEYGKTRFAGIKDNVVANYEGDILKVGVDATFKLSPYAWSSKNNDYFYKLDWSDVNWHVEFNPFKMVGFGFSDELYTEGAELFVWDDNLPSGNYSTDGFAVLIRPAKEFTFGAGVDFPAYFDDLDNDHDLDPALAIGMDYNAEQFSIGAAIHHLTNSDARRIGVHAAIKAIEGLGLHVGFTHAENADVGLGDVSYAPSGFVAYYKDQNNVWQKASGFDRYYGMGGKNVLDASVSYSFSPFDFAADLAISLDSDDADYDLYSAAKFMFNLDSVSKGLGLDVKGFILYDMGDAGKTEELGTTWGIQPQIVYKMGNAKNSEDAAKHEFRAGVIFQNKFSDDRDWAETKYWYFGLPVSWKYTY